ncbi:MULTISPECIES: pilus assembly protein TadG-related protein [Cryobacterium]|nr:MULTISPECIES: pilus assembly protein TadG-related protein [Cryobacterium]
MSAAAVAVMPAATRRALPIRLRDEDGSTLILTIFYGFLAMALILIVVAATSLYLERKRLLTLADGAALAGAEAFDLGAVTVAGDGSGAVLRPALASADVSAAAQEYLATAPHGRMEELRVSDAASVDGQSATVSLSAYWRPPVLSILLQEGVPLEVTAVARSVFR